MKILAREKFWNANVARYSKKLDAPQLNSENCGCNLEVKIFYTFRSCFEWLDAMDTMQPILQTSEFYQTEVL